MPKKRKISTIVIPSELIEKRIYLIRGQKVMLDTNLAELYGVETRALVQAVKRNLDRFPEDFMLQLTKKELELWRSQIVISKPAARMALRRRPYAFTEQGVAMLSSVLRSSQAVKVNIAIMRSRARRFSHPVVVCINKEVQLGWGTTSFSRISSERSLG